MQLRKLCEEDGLDLDEIVSREPKKEARRFINDTVRNDFHRKFLSKYIK